jgi:hypothetical protein
VRDDMVEGVQCLQQMALNMHELVRRNLTLRITESGHDEEDDVSVD